MILKVSGQAFSVQRTIATALLLSNARAIYLASKWPSSEMESDAGPQSVWEKFAEYSARRVWPVGRYVLVLLSVLEVAGITGLLLGPGAA